MRYLILVLFLVPIVCFSQTKEDLVGTSWKIADFEILNAPEEMDTMNQPCIDKARMTFTNEFIVTESYKGSNCNEAEKSQQIEYKIENNKLLSFNEASAEWETMEIASFSSTKMIIHQNLGTQTAAITLEKVIE